MSWAQLSETNIDPDADLERRIDEQYLIVWFGKTPEQRTAACRELARLVPLRSPEQVERMEREILR